MFLEALIVTFVIVISYLGLRFSSCRTESHLHSREDDICDERSSHVSELACYISERTQHTRSGLDERLAHEGKQAALVLNVLDGDTIEVSTLFRKMIVRLDSIDAPELDQHWGDSAKFALTKMVAGKRVFMNVHGDDCKGRVLATLYVHCRGDLNLVDVNLKMVAQGHAWVRKACYGHLSDERRLLFDLTQDWAQSKGEGLWQSHMPIPPWKWKRES